MNSKVLRPSRRSVLAGVLGLGVAAAVAACTGDTEGEASSSAPTPSRTATRAAVLSGGGLLGACWQAGIASRLADSGIRLKDADLIVGTSAGAITGAQIASGGDLRVLVDFVQGAGATIGKYITPERFQAMFEAMAQAGQAATPVQGRRNIGRLAMESTGLNSADYLRLFDTFESTPWPTQYTCTAVNARTGELVFWGRDSQVPLTLGVASSCAAPMVMPAVEIQGNAYLDGGLASNLNSHRAAEHDRIVVISCLPVTDPAPDPTQMQKVMAAQAAGEIETLRRNGRRVELIEPGEKMLRVALTDQGLNLMDFTKTQEAFEAGRAEAAALGERIASVWTV